VADQNSSSKSSPKKLGGLWRILPYLRPYKWSVLGALAALIVAAGTVLVIGQAIRRVMDFGFSGVNPMVDQYFIGLMAVVAVLAAATFARYYLVTWLGERLIADLRSDIYSHVINLSPAFFDHTRIGEVLSRLTADTTLIQTVIGSSASIAMRNILLFAGGSVLLVFSSPKLAGMAIILVPAVVLPIVIFGRQVRRLSRDSQDRIADVSSYAEETLNAVQIVQAFCHEAIDIMRFNIAVESSFNTAIKRTRARAWLTALVMLLIFGAVDLVVWAGAKDVIAGDMSSGELAAFVFYAIVVAGALGALSEVYGELQRAAGAGERLLELLQVENDIALPENPVAMPLPGEGAVAMSDVTFHYPSRPEGAALRNFNLTVNPGETIALVGPSGAGKTTVFQMLLRFYDPQSGEVRVDGVAATHADPLALRGRISLVPQDPVIFAASVTENIRYGRPGASDDEVRAAAKAANAAAFIEALADGYDTYLGERGTRLSGGQRQRIAIARAMLRNSPILLLDEATSALDAESERLVQKALNTIMKGRTTIVIAHRLATVLRADRIVVMDQGEVVEQGRHDELVKLGGLYAHLAALQFDQAPLEPDLA
jgi:ATP-binding cassette subfamily B protein